MFDVGHQQWPQGRAELLGWSGPALPGIGDGRWDVRSGKNVGGREGSGTFPISVKRIGVTAAYLTRRFARSRLNMVLYGVVG